jgi:demethylmenaquinone methyltransferase/2-methoxy-6-polyprenyl-1,4-benzoquinol methylase
MNPSSPTARQPSDELRRLFDASAALYNRVDALGSFGTGLRYRRDALGRAGLQPGMRVVDVACGTGLMSLAAFRLTQNNLKIIGVDPSPGMMSRVPNQLPIELRQGTASSLPVDSGRGDFLMMGYALRHVDDWRVAFAEFARILRPGGRLLILELTCPRNHLGRLLFHAYFGGILPALGFLATARPQAWRLYRYYWRSMVQARPPKTVVETLSCAGFTDVAHSTRHGFLSEYTAVRS